MEKIRRELIIDGDEYTLEISDRDDSTYPLKLELRQPNRLLPFGDIAVCESASKVKERQLRRKITEMVETQLDQRDEIEELVDDILEDMEDKYEQVDV